MTSAPTQSGPVMLDLANVRKANDGRLRVISDYRRATNYLAAAMIYLQDNVLLDQPLKPEHIKERLLGHWGTCPGINLVYAHLNRLLVDNADAQVVLVTGPGHGAPAALANLWMEGSLQKFYPGKYDLTFQGLFNLVKGFSWPGGFPSHVNAEVPGSIHEGGELGYALSVAFGAALDNPALVVACIVGDGEAETSATAAAWHSYKFLDPAKDGAVLPIVHINGYKISNPTIYGTMSDMELYHLFTGYGYTVRFVGEDADKDADMLASMDWAYGEIRRIQSAARAGTPINCPKWPVLLMRTLKGWTGVHAMNGEEIEGTWRSHQVPLKDARTNAEALTLLEAWLRSYRIQDLFEGQQQNSQSFKFPDQLTCICPEGDRRLGANPVTLGGRSYTGLRLPDRLSELYATPVPSDARARAATFSKGMYQVGIFLRDVIKSNPGHFRIFSPDELESNQLSAVFEATHRTYQWPITQTDRLNHIERNHGGAVMEILNEHQCQGWLQGYLLTGRHGVFPCYEAFLGIIATMMDQFAKFTKVCREVPWRHDIPSLNYIEASTLWRQEHNGYSHQNPGFINTLLNKRPSMQRVYLPPDANCVVATMSHCLASTNLVNLVVAAKHPMPNFLSMDEAIVHCRQGASIWPFLSTERGLNPDVVLVGIGAELTVEVCAAAQLLRELCPPLRVRVVNVTDLMVLERHSDHPHGLSQELFASIFTTNKPLVFNFHGYPSAVAQLLFARHGVSERTKINGYREVGTTTTPFDMLIQNGCSRYHLMIQAIKAGAVNPAVELVEHALVSQLEYKIRDHSRYIVETGNDPKEILDFKFTF